MTRMPHSLMALGVSSLLPIGCQAKSQTTGNSIDDSVITTSVKTHLATDSTLTTMTQSGVRTLENTVSVTGVAPTLQAENRAEESARQVDGVQRVVNDITVQPQPVSETVPAFDPTPRSSAVHTGASRRSSSLSAARSARRASPATAGLPYLRRWRRRTVPLLQCGAVRPISLRCQPRSVWLISSEPETDCSRVLVTTEQF